MLTDDGTFRDKEAVKLILIHCVCRDALPAVEMRTHSHVDPPAFKVQFYILRELDAGDRCLAIHHVVT